MARPAEIIRRHSKENAHIKTCQWVCPQKIWGHSARIAAHCALPMLDSASMLVPNDATGRLCATAAHLVRQPYAWANKVITAMLTLYTWLIVRPIAILYFGGPSLGGWGFWNGTLPEDICAALTQVRADHWTKDANQLECQRIIDKNFHAFVIAVHAVVYTYILWKLFHYAWIRCVVEPYQHKRELHLMEAKLQLLQQWRTTAELKALPPSSAALSSMVALMGTGSPIS